jgi:hypothetical protein
LRTTVLPAGGPVRAALARELDCRPNTLPKRGRGLLADLFGDLATEPTEEYLAPAILAIQEVCLEPSGRAPAQLARNILRGVALGVV